MSPSLARLARLSLPCKYRRSVSASKIEWATMRIKQRWSEFYRQSNKTIISSRVDLDMKLLLMGLASFGGLDFSIICWAYEREKNLHIHRPPYRRCLPVYLILIAWCCAFIAFLCCSCALIVTQPNYLIRDHLASTLTLGLVLMQFAFYLKLCHLQWYRRRRIWWWMWGRLPAGHIEWLAATLFVAGSSTRLPSSFSKRFFGCCCRWYSWQSDPPLLVHPPARGEWSAIWSRKRGLWGWRWDRGRSASRRMYSGELEKCLWRLLPTPAVWWRSP